MSATASALRATQSFSPGREVELLRGALDEKVLVELGWDARAQAVRRVVEHPSFGLPECEVEGCEGMITRRGNVCMTCWERFLRWRVKGRCSDLEEFKRIRRKPPPAPERVCAVCCEPPDHVRPARATGLCNAHDGQRGYRGLTVSEFIALEDVVPLATFGVCRREGCGRIAEGRVGLCRRCAGAWRKRGRPELDLFCAAPWRIEQVAQVAPISLVGLPERLRLELLFVSQQFSLQQRKRSREAWRGLVRDARAAGVGSLLELERADATCAVLMVRRLAHRELEVLYADPETEFAADVWDLRKAGLITGRSNVFLDFSTITQDWLRAAAKGWARCRGAYTPGQSLQAGCWRCRCCRSRLSCGRIAAGRCRRSLVPMCARSSSGSGGCIGRAGCRSPPTIEVRGRCASSCASAGTSVCMSGVGRCTG